MSQKMKTNELVRLTGESSREVIGSAAQSLRGLAAAQKDSPKQTTAILWSDLQGTWAGNQGLNVIAVPGAGSTPTSQGSFKLLVNQYSEILEFVNPGAPARNRGGDVDQFVAALEYEQRVTDKATSELLHVENGMFLNLSTIVKNGTTDPEPIPEFNIARSGTIPHGDSIMLLGPPPVVTSGPPDIAPSSALPTNLGPHPRLGYTDPYLNHPAGADVTDPSALLTATLKAQGESGVEVVQTTTFLLDSDNAGSVTNVPYIVQRANTTRMRATFWLEKMHNKNTGQEFDQLQYVQIIDIEFHQNSDDPATGLILWPHITVNTLVKQ